MAQSGDIVTFKYVAIHRGSRAHDPNPKVLVLHPDFEGKMHGLNIGYFSQNDMNMLRMILSVGFEQRYKASLTRQSPEAVKLFEKIMSEASVTDINSPQQFYYQVIKPIIKPRGYEPYRQYTVQKIGAITIVERAEVMTSDVDPAAPEAKSGLFQKVFNRLKNWRGQNRAPNFRGNK